MFFLSLNWFFILSFIFLTYVVRYGDCLTCYTCSSDAGGDCDFPINIIKVYENKCAPHENRCFVVNKTINGYRRIRRGCSDEDYCPGNTRVFSTGCSDCSWDLCNSSPQILLSWIILVTLIVFNFVY
ncbi:hypothetical protein ILUMI_12493 [Ignelater luminosus]|uniref:Protein sleepless n=1 Tax=Ignelater luminosus TaxID=2038154 RepID=A0A8K0CU48_IGNLU|nr:hypothetical protein ILUMI_12493 [Ignelater luminosus]